MSRIDTNFVKQLYSQAGVELTPEKLDHISNNYSSNEELQSAFELKYGSMNASTPEKKNSDVTSVSTSEAPQSESQQPQKKASSLSVGEKPKKTGASASSTGGGKKVGGKEVKKESKSEDLISKFGFKNKEEQKKVGVEASKIKVDAKTPTAVKSVSVKEEQFVKPELQKIQKEFSSPKFKKELEENKESILSKEQRDLISSGIDSSIEMKQSEGLLPPTSELIKSGDIRLDIYSGGQFDELLNPKSFTEMLEQQSKPFVDQIKEQNKPVKVNYDNLILANDYNLPNPYLYYSNSKNGGDNQVNELYTNNLSSLPINKDDFDGFLRKKGFLDDFNKDLSSGLYNEDRGTFSENYNAKLIKEKRLVDFLSSYISDRNQRDYDKRVIEYKKENPKATAEDIDKNVSKFTFVSDKQFGDYIKNTFPTYAKSIEERKIKEKEQWEETKKNKGDFFSWQTLKKIGSGLSETISSRVSNLSSTVYDLIGMEDTAKQIRFSAEEDAFKRPENRDISYVSGKKVLYDGNEYLVDSNGQIYDYNLKKRVTDLFTNTDYKLITKAAEKGEDDNLFSWTGATVQTTNVLADLALQIALTRGAGAGGNIVKSGLSKEGLSILSKVPVSQGMASSATAQTFLGYSEGLENTLVAAKEAGISDSEAKALANDAAIKTAGLYLVTSGISPQTKATFVKQKNELIKEAIEVYAKKGKPAYVKFLNKGINGLTEFFKEGTKETLQEDIQQAGTVYGVNQSINEQAGQEILKSEMTADEIISMLPSTFIAGGIPIMLRNAGSTFSKKDYLSNLDVASNNVDLSNKRLDELLSNNVITSEEHSKSKEDLRVYSQNKNKIPKDTSAEIVLDVAKGLDEISKLESQKQNLDKAFHSDIDEKIEKKREEIKDLYKKDKENESNKQTTGQVSEQEKPAITTEAETTVATQQKTELQPQEEVNTTSKTTELKSPIELNDGEELIDVKEDGKGNTYTYVSNVEVKDDVKTTTFSFNRSDKPSSQRNKTSIDSGKILDKYGYEINQDQIPEDSKLVSITEIREGKDSSAATVFFETDGQKYEAEVKLTPKTETDAVQEQITNEGVLQPKQSEMGLQEMEQGDKVDQKPTEQGKEKVNTKVSDPYTSSEVERVKALPKEAEDGATMNLDGSKYEDGGLVIPLASKNMDASELTPEAIQEFIDENAESIGEDNVKVGIYKFPNSNQVSIDISIVADPSMREEGIAIGKELGQESLFDLDTFENVKTGADGMNPKKLSPSEFRAIQERLKLKSKGIEVSKDTNEAKKQLSKVENKKVAKAIINGVKAISKILPNVKVIIHDTDSSFRAVSGESKNQESSGLYQNGEIHINLPKANSRTVAHEIFHAILLDKVKTDANAQAVTKKMIESIASKIDGNPALKAKLEEFASMYDENIQNEEKLAELVGMLAENYDSFSARVKEIIKNWLNNLAKSFGVELFETNEVFDVLNTIAKKVATGKDISEKDILSIGEENVSVSDLTNRFQANFKDPVSGVEFVYDKNTDKFIKLEKDGFITKDKSITDFNGKILFLHQPDAAFSGLIFKNGELLVEGKGGMYYPIKFHEDGYFWASTSNTAKKMAEDLNKVYEANGGQILMALTTAPSSKLLSSTTAANGVMELILSKAFDRNFSINKDQIKKSLVNASNKTIVKKSLIKDKKTKKPILDKKGNKQYKEKNVGLNLKLKKGDSLDSIKSEIKNKLNPENSSFDDRKAFVELFLSEIANVINLNPKAINQFATFFSKGIENKAFKGISKTGKLSVSAANLKQAVSEMLTEPMLKEGVERNKGGQVYAVIELNGNVKPVDSNKHESYPKAIQSVDPKNNKVTLHILKDRVKWNEVFEDPVTNEIVSEDRELEIFPTSGVSKTGLKLNTKNIKSSTRQQKSLPVKVAEKLTEDGDGNFVFKHYSDQRRDVIKKGQGTNRITSREEASALGAVGGLAMFYTMEGQVEPGVGNVEHTILVSKDKVYDIDSDPLGFEKEARKRFNEVRPGQAFTNNHRGAFITQVANENGFDIAVTQWRGSELRAQSTKELTPSEKSVEFKERPLDTFKEGDYAIIDGRESLITNVDGNKLRYESLDGVAKGTTINNERNRRNIIKIYKPSVRMQKPKKLSTQINKVVGVKPKATEQKRINKAFGLGIAEQKIETEAQKQKTKLVKDELSELNKQFKDVVSALNKVRDVEQREKLEKQKKKIQENIDKIKNNFKIELSDIKDQFKDIFSSTKDVLSIEKKEALEKQKANLQEKAKNSRKRILERKRAINELKKKLNDFVSSSINGLDAGDIGKRAIISISKKVQSITEKNFEEKLLEVNEILDNLYTNRDVNKAKSDSKNAYNNVMSGKLGKLDKEGDMDKVMSSKVVGLTMLDPNILKKVLSDDDFSQYKDYINRLAEKALAIKETDLKAIDALYDRIIGPYKNHVSEVNRIQQIIDAGGTLSADESKFVDENKSEFSERETPESIAEKEAKKADRDAKKEAEIAEKKRKIKELLPFISDVFASSVAEKGSIEWDILENLSNLTDEDIESMPENMLNNVVNALNSMVYNDVLVSYANEIHKYKLKQDHKKTFADTLSKAGKKGVYKAKLIKPLLKIREVIGLPISAIWRGAWNRNLKQEIIDRRLKFFNFSSIDAALKIYGETPIFDNIMSRFGKAMARISSAEERAETILLKVKKDLDKKSKNPQESYMKIVYHLIDAMAKNNVGNKSDVSAMEYFEATISDPNSKIADNNRAKKVIQDFIDKVKANNNEIDELTKEELNAVNAIRKVLDENKINAYEANFFQNSNASPMINAYYPVMNSLKNQAEQDLVKLKNRFGMSNIVSIKSGNLEEKTGTAHPIDMNPFSNAFSSIKSTIFQHQLRTEYQALKQALSELEIENFNNKEVLSYLSGIKKAVDSQFELLTNGVVGTEQTLADDILNAVDKSFYTLALGSVISRGVDFLGNMVQLAAISPKMLANNRKVLNNLLAIKKDDESGTEILRNFYKNAEASEINKMISSKKISTERTEFMKRGADRGVLSKGLPSSNVGTKVKAKFVDPITSTTSGAVDLLLGFGDVKPYGISWNGVFYEEFKKQAGVEVDVEKIARGDIEYLKRYKDAIKKASNKANQENADLYGSTNPMEKKVGIMEIAKKPVKSSLAGAIGALRNKAAYLFSSFDMNARNAINTSINTYIENQDSREARKLIGGAARLAMYSASINYITSALWNAFKGDDDDEDELKKSFDKLSDNDDFIKYVNSSLLDFPIQKDAEGNIIQLSLDDLDRYNEMRDKLMSNKEFAKAYDIMYGYLNRDLFDIQVRSKVNQINQGNYEYDRSVVDGFFTDIDNGFGKSGEDIIEVLGILNSEQGYKMFTQEEIDENILKVEEYMSKIDFLNNRAIRESGGAIDRLLITKVASTLSDYRTDASIESVRNTEGLKLLMGMMFSRSNNFGKAAANYSAEFANKLITESKRGERGYDVYKDGIFQSPVKYKLKEDASLVNDAVNILFPAFQKFDKYKYSDYSLPELIRFTPMGILGVNDFAKINSKMKNDVIYQETNGKYKENILKDISKTKIDILRDKKKLEQDRLDEQFKKSRVIPGVKETKLKSRFPSYSKNKDLKVNGRSAN